MAETNLNLPSTTLVVFGISGDLSGRYLLPALAEICYNSEFKANLKILGLSRRPIAAGEVLTEKTNSLADQFEVLQIDYQQANEYEKLKGKLAQLNSRQVIFYFAVPPEAVLPIIGHLGQAGMNKSNYKLLMEKPFGRDLNSAHKLIEQTNKFFKEAQIYRIDHYLAKEMAQNIAVFLGSNTLFRNVWSKQFIEKIEIVAEESIGIEGRVHFYEQTGALRDFQSHLLQLTALTLMEPCPDTFDFSQMPGHRLEALKHLKIEPSSAVKAQYEGYKSEVNNNYTKIETFVAFELKSTASQWHGVPIWLITGKRLPEKLTEIRIHFKGSQSAKANLLHLRLQPKEGIELSLWVKKPGYDQNLQKLPLDFLYHQYFGKLPDAYEQVIVDAIRSRANLFASSQEVLAGWQILEPILANWDEREPRLYKPGSSVEDILKNT